jgi:hypothetical protein
VVLGGRELLVEGADLLPGLAADGEVQAAERAAAVGLGRPVGEELVEGGSTSGELVLDPFAGSGTTCKTAKDLGRRYLGIEIDGRYAGIARLRIRVRGYPRPRQHKSLLNWRSSLARALALARLRRSKMKRQPGCSLAVQR